MSSSIIPVNAEMPFVFDEEMAQLVFREAELQQEREFQQVLKAWKGRSHTAQRGVRLPDGTHMAYKIPRVAYDAWGRKLGYECWDDAQFVHEFLRDNPECRVHAEAANPTILSGWAPSERVKKYRKLKGQGAAA